MHDRNLTEGARRAIERALHLAQQANTVAHGGHLLASLLAEESAAFERLEHHGLIAQSVDLTALTSPASGSRQAQQEWDEIQWQADQWARQEGRGVEVSTEHLLSALTVVASPVQTLLQRAGLGAPVVIATVTEKYAPPIAANFEIRWSDATENERTRTLRVLDAAANRAREGLRVVEDFVRFTLDDGFLSRQLKTMRHELGQALRSLNDMTLLHARDTQADVGTAIHIDSEMQRTSLLDVAIANLKRIEEATRTLEEFSKVATAFDRSSTELQQLPQRLGQVRYQLYTLEKAILTTFDSQHRLDGAHLYLLLTQALCQHSWESVLRQAITGGVRVVQIREKGMSDRELLAHAERVRQITRETNTLLIMNDRPDLAVLCDADGVHVGQDELSVSDARRIIGPDHLVGVSTHSIDQARQAVLDGANYIGVGPTFTSRTKSFSEFAGLDYVRQVAEEISLPAFAIGGIDRTNCAQVRAAGASRIAVTGAVCRAENPTKYAAELVSLISGPH